MNKTQDKQTYVLIQPDPQNHVIDVTWQYLLFYRIEAEKRSCFIPGFNIYFSSPDDDTIMERKSEAMTKMYLDHFVMYSKTGFKALAMQLHKLGFKAKDDAITLKRIFNNQMSKTKFNAIVGNVPDSFNESKSIHHKKEFAIAE